MQSAHRLCFLLLIIVVLFLIAALSYADCNIYGDQNQWIRWQHGSPNAVLENLRSKSPCIVALVGNGKLSEEHRRQINKATYIVRCNSCVHMREGERTDLLIQREYGASTLEKLRLQGLKPEYKELGVVVITNRTHKKIAHTAEERARTLMRLLKKKSSNANLFLGRVHVDEMSSMRPYVKTTFPECPVWGPSTGYVAVLVVINFLRTSMFMVCPKIEKANVTKRAKNAIKTSYRRNIE